MHLEYRLSIFRRGVHRRNGGEQDGCSQSIAGMLELVYTGYRPASVLILDALAFTQKYQIEHLIPELGAEAPPSSLFGFEGKVFDLKNEESSNFCTKCFAL